MPSSSQAPEPSRVLVGGDAEQQHRRDAAARAASPASSTAVGERRGGRRRAWRRSACGRPGPPRRTAAGRGRRRRGASRARGRAARRCGAGGAGGWPGRPRPSIVASGLSGLAQSSRVSAKMSWSSHTPSIFRYCSARPSRRKPAFSTTRIERTLRGMTAGWTRCSPACSKAKRRTAAPPRVAWPRPPRVGADPVAERRVLPRRRARRCASATRPIIAVAALASSTANAKPRARGPRRAGRASSSRALAGARVEAPRRGIGSHGAVCARLAMRSAARERRRRRPGSSGRIAVGAVVEADRVGDAAERLTANRRSADARDAA